MLLQRSDMETQANLDFTWLRVAARELFSAEEKDGALRARALWRLNGNSKEDCCVLLSRRWPRDLRRPQPGANPTRHRPRHTSPARLFAACCRRSGSRPRSTWRLARRPDRNARG